MEEVKEVEEAKEKSCLRSLLPLLLAANNRRRPLTAFRIFCDQQQNAPGSLRRSGLARSEEWRVLWKILVPDVVVEPIEIRLQ